MAAFDQVNTTGAPVHVPALGRIVQPDEVVTFDDLITGFTPVPAPSADVAAATAQLEADLSGAPTAPDVAPSDTPTPAKQKAAAATKKES